MIYQGFECLSFIKKCLYFADIKTSLKTPSYKKFLHPNLIHTSCMTSTFLLPPTAAVCLFSRALTTVACFSALGNGSLKLWGRLLAGYGWLFSRALTTVACFPALGKGCLFSRALTTVASFPAPRLFRALTSLTCFPAVKYIYIFSNFRLRSWLIGL